MSSWNQFSTKTVEQRLGRKSTSSRFPTSARKKRYIYYHCTGYRGKCPEPYTREEVLEAQFATLLHDLTFDADVMVWLAEALHQTRADDQAQNAAEIKRLQTDSARIARRIEDMYLDKLDGQTDSARIARRIEDMYLDKLDGRVGADFYDLKAAEWRREMIRLGARIEERQATARTYLPEGVRLIELARRAPDLFETQAPHEKRRLLNFLLSNCSWKDGALHAEFRQPFDMLAVAAKPSGGGDAGGSGGETVSKKWLLREDLNLQPSG